MKNMMDMMGMLKKAQAVQSQMATVQNKMGATDFVGESAGGAVKITVNGKLEAKKISLDASVVDKDDIETLEDLILVAINNAREAVEDANAKAFEGIKKNLDLPDNFELPF
ncbi:MAG: YbaB/EbfC family nucleoid-associated protein [Alphaproteobacteria bacterium]|nr:YbaB/EbfC family nucleoid-associated protein [Alphaproteobacteria bacterium]MBQ4084158.1 YbaB/EbfC family nucleoid-associated protein [Alphaproteobacteria bacterium]